MDITEINNIALLTLTYYTLNNKDNKFLIK